ncbi:type I restriction enzyme HsdR N-terminal domain-containing protein [Leptolyngbya sp. PCC 6406]|uniref:type I restriction enzyme HsdR N-terminal domain-containing protein n=1 Tax=Leptolyngbya sp. PCC 6406 TaxID=1173264 RepID=UPI0002ACFB9F|nr:type I restriction enzyme HsdR N-terminal domain-containing protein [Leptolyngbya sp. PCC 6406]
MVQVAITEAITTLAEVERRFHLHRTEDEDFFAEWQSPRPKVGLEVQRSLTQLRQRYLYHRSLGSLLEGTVTLLLVSPLLAIAGLYDPPFRVRTEASVQITLDDGEDVLRGRIDVLVLQETLWVVVVEAKKNTLSAWSALPQTLAYLMANPQPAQPGYGLITNGDDILFVKLQAGEVNRYGLSRGFALFTSAAELEQVWSILHQIGSRISGEAL